MKIVLFVLGIIFYAAGVVGTLHYSASFNEEHLNFAYGSMAAIFVGFILSIIGYMKITAPPTAA